MNRLDMFIARYDLDRYIAKQKLGRQLWAAVAIMALVLLYLTVCAADLIPLVWCCILSAVFLFIFMISVWASGVYYTDKLDDAEDDDWLWG